MDIKDIQPPKAYLTCKWEKREGFQYEQPVEYCNNQRLSIISFGQDFGVPYVIAKRESDAYNNALKYTLYNSDLWKSKKIKNKAFKVIYNFILNGGSESCSSITPLFPFEIHMLNDGFEMMSFCELNAVNPGLSFLSTKQEGDKIINPTGFKSGRYYIKNDVAIYMYFGMEVKNIKTNFYFRTSKNKDAYFQVDNSKENYLKAINGELKNLIE